MTSGRLPSRAADLPAHAVAIDTTQGTPAILYLGTDRGVWRSVDHGARWGRDGHGTLPNAPVIDVRLDARRKRILAATQGRGLWSAPALVRTADLSVPTHNK